MKIWGQRCTGILSFHLTLSPDRPPSIKSLVKLNCTKIDKITWHTDLYTGTSVRIWTQQMYNLIIIKMSRSPGLNMVEFTQTVVKKRNPKQEVTFSERRITTRYIIQWGEYTSRPVIQNIRQTGKIWKLKFNLIKRNDYLSNEGISS